MTREIDTRIAVEFFGWQRDEHGGYETPTGYRLPDEVPHYSTKIALAWEVVEKLSATHRVNLHQFGKLWQCSLEARDGKMRFPVEMSHDGDAHANAETPALSICLAALATRPAGGGDPKEDCDGGR